MGPGDAKREALLGFKNRLRVQNVLARLPAQLRAPGLTLLASPVSPPALAGVSLRKSSQRHSGEGVAAGAVGSSWQRSPLHTRSWAAPSTWHTFPLPRPSSGEPAQGPPPQTPLGTRHGCSPSSVPGALAAVTSVTTAPIGPRHPRVVIPELLVLKRSLMFREGREAGTSTGMS